MNRLLRIPVFLFCLGVVLAGCQSSNTAPRPADADAGGAAVQVTCPVCGLRFSRSEAQAMVRHRKKTYYFLLPDHAQAFKLDPDYYIQSNRRGREPKDRQ